MHYEMPSFGRSPWKPGFWSRAPWFGILALFGSFICAIGTAIVLVTSNGREHESWPTPDLWVQPSVVISVLTAAANALVIMAFQEGVTISWWLKMLEGGDLNDCHRYWFYANNVWASLTAGRHFNKVALACLMVAIVVVDGPVMQRASSIRSITADTPRNFSLAIGQDILEYPSGWYTSRAPAVDTLSGNFTQVLAGYNNRDPIRPPRVEGCRGTCRGDVLAPGWDVSCTYESRKAPGTPDIAKQVGAGNITVVFNGPYQSGSINVSTLFAPHGLMNEMVAATCNMQIGIIKHHIDVASNGDVTLVRKSLTSPVNDTVRTDWPYLEAAGMGTFPSKVGGIALAAGNIYNSEITLYNGASLQIEGKGPMAYAYRNSSDDVLGSENMTWADPTPDVVAAIQELTFRSAVHYTNDTTPLVAAAEGREVLTMAVYESHYNFLLGGLIVMLLATFAMIPLFHGWWNLGRDVSLSPVEIAMAFKAPHTDGGDANADVSTLLKQIGKRRAQYGVVATGDFPASPGLTTGFREAMSPGLGPDPTSRPGSAMARGPPSIMLQDIDSKSRTGTFSPEPRSPLAIADPKILRKPSRDA